MKMDRQFVEKIVRNVFANLQKTDHAARPSATLPKTKTAPKTTAAAKTEQTIATNQTVHIDGKVVTADLLEKIMRQKQSAITSLTVETKALLTPSAHDFLRQHRISWNRGNVQTQSGSVNQKSTTAVRWQAVMVTVTPTIRTLLGNINQQNRAGNHHEHWQQEIIGHTHEAVSLAVGEICRASIDGAVIFTKEAEIAACLANRQHKVRAAVGIGTQQIQTVQQQLGANIFCINPTDKSFIELRNMLRTISRGGKPTIPKQWAA